jgi:transcription elongation factor GreA
MAVPPVAKLLAVAEVTKLSQEAFDRLQAEFDDLTTRGRIEIAHKIEAARELGDLSENGDYHAAKEEQGKMEGRIAHLGKLIENAEIVEVSTSGGDRTVQAGCVVSIRYNGDDDVEKYLLGSIEERRDGLTVMSPGSPLGQALMGAGVDDTVTFEAPSGPLGVTVVDIEY